MKHVTVTVDEAFVSYKALLNLAHKDGSLWNEGMEWYADAQLLAVSIATEQIQPVIGGDLTRSVRLAAALIAAASPQKSWEKGVNQRLARQWAAQLAAGKPARGHMGQHNAKAEAVWAACVNGDPSVDELSRILTISESKVSRFFRNILGDMSYMTIDGHMINAAYNGLEFVAITNARQSVKEVRACDEALLMAADAYGLTPAHAQAIIWVTYKSLSGEKR